MDLKRKALKKLQQDIAAKKPFARYNYIERKNEEPCYCAVGHIMNTCGIDLSEMEEDSEVNGSCISGLYLGKYFKQLSEFGFTLEELQMLQNFNDRLEHDAIVAYVKEKLA